MSKATITSKGQITIPLDIRTALNLRERDRLEFRVKGNAILAQPIRNQLMTLAGVISAPVKVVSKQEIRQSVQRSLAERHGKKGKS